MASELLKTKALAAKIKEPKVRDFDFGLNLTSVESLIPDLPQPKPQELLDIQDYELDLGDAETWYEEGMTVADAEKLVADRKAYEAKMLTDYKAGRLDPQSGEKGRESFLRKKMEEMEMSGDKRLMSEDEIMELVDIENRRKLNASGGLNYLMGL